MPIPQEQKHGMLVRVPLADFGFQSSVILVPLEISHANRHGKVDHVFASFAPCVANSLSCSHAQDIAVNDRPTLFPRCRSPLVSGTIAVAGKILLEQVGGRVRLKWFSFHWIAVSGLSQE